MPEGSAKESCEELTIAVEGAAAIVTLDRPQSGNALSGAIRSRIAESIPRFARDPGVYALIMRSGTQGAFSVGSDLRELGSAAKEQPERARQLLADTYRLSWILECFSKPTISLIDGLIMGSAAGLTAYGTHRVAGETFSFALPQTGFGFFADAGLSWVCARMPDEIGVYLGLTGRRIGRADAYRLGLVTHCIPASRFSEIEAGLRSADPVDPLLDDRHEEPGPGEIESYREVLQRCFAAETVEEICSRLRAEAQRGGAAGGWCEDVLQDLSRRSPTALKITLRHIREAAFRDLRQTLMIDCRLACRLVGSHDFREGVRVLLANQDRPRWIPEHLSEVSEATVDRIFAFQPGRELILPTRQEMQAARF
ncbi:MAG TPA: enoyl-CoA hydratase/isomerase family protein [Hyphomicrobiaceae bacterium]|jgi:enoyl-CoA hydratase